MEVGLDLVAAYENGVVYTKDILFTPIEDYINNVKAAYRAALCISMKAGFYTKENIKMFIGKVYREMQALSKKVLNG
jgi:large subunit ribosomal protein L10